MPLAAAQGTANNDNKREKKKVAKLFEHHRATLKAGNEHIPMWPVSYIGENSKSNADDGRLFRPISCFPRIVRLMERATTKLQRETSTRHIAQCAAQAAGALSNEKTISVCNLSY
jgi:hypothetical protein